MNLYDQALMQAPSLTPGYCIVCGDPHTTRHHPVKRSQGGINGPVLELCGHGTMGCHGQAEQRRLHFRYASEWQYVETQHPTKYATALELDGWQVCR